MVVESIAASPLCYLPLCGGYGSVGTFVKQRRVHRPMVLSKDVFGKRFTESLPLLSLRADKGIKCQAMELTKEAYAFRDDQIRRDLELNIDTGIEWKPSSWPPENKADNPRLHNPLLRQERMGCGWLAAIFEWEGVLIDENPDLEKQAWLVLSEENGKPPPPAFILHRLDGMKNEQAISEVLCWSRDPMQVKRMASRKEEIYQALQGGIYSFRPGSKEFINILIRYKIPMALVSTQSRKAIETAIHVSGIEGIFTVVVAAEDVHRGKPDPDMFVYAAQLLQYLPERCIVFGNSNKTVEAAHDARMKCVAVASKHPLFELGAADLVVKSLDELSVVDLKNLAAVESAEFGANEPELEMETEEEEDTYPSASTFDDDIFW